MAVAVETQKLEVGELEITATHQLLRRFSHPEAGHGVMYPHVLAGGGDHIVVVGFDDKTLEPQELGGKGDEMREVPDLEGSHLDRVYNISDPSVALMVAEEGVRRALTSPRLRPDEMAPESPVGYEGSYYFLDSDVTVGPV